MEYFRRTMNEDYMIEEVDDILKKNKFFTKFPLPLANLLYYLAVIVPKRLTLTINDLTIDVDRYDDVVVTFSLKAGVIVNISLSIREFYFDILNSIKEDEKLIEIDEQYFTPRPLIDSNVQIAYVEEGDFAEKVKKYMDEYRQADRFPLSLSDFIYFTTLVEPNYFMIGDQLVYLDKNSGYFQIGEMQFALLPYVTFNHIKKFVDNAVDNNTINNSPFEDIIINNESLEADELNPQTLIDYIIKLSNEYFSDDLSYPLRPIIDKILGVLGDDWAVKVDFDYGDIATRGIISFKSNNKHELSSTYATEIENSFFYYDLDITKHIIVYDGQISENATIHTKPLLQVNREIIMYFGIYPVNVYYSPDGLGYYRTKLDNLCSNTSYSLEELTEWYRETYYDKDLSTRSKMYMCDKIRKWISSLTVKDLDL